MARESMFDNLAEVQSIRARTQDIAMSEGRACQRCAIIGLVRRGHRGCAYAYPEISKDPEAKAGDANDPNYATLCEGCWEEDNEYWREMWEEYYGGRL